MKIMSGFWAEPLPTSIHRIEVKNLIFALLPQCHPAAAAFILSIWLWSVGWPNPINLARLNPDNGPSHWIWDKWICLAGIALPLLMKMALQLHHMLQTSSSLKTSCANLWLTQKCITWFIAHNYVWPGMRLGKRGTVSPFSFACLLLTDQFWPIGWQPWVKDVVNLLGRASAHDLADVPALSFIIRGEFFNWYPPKNASR